jgi:hypothetical protein
MLAPGFARQAPALGLPHILSSVERSLNKQLGLTLPKSKITVGTLVPGEAFIRDHKVFPFDTVKNVERRP